MAAKPSFSWWALLLCAGALVAQDDADSESPTITSLDEIEVTASHSILREEPVSAVALSREQIDNLPHFGDDLYRTISVLPGTSGGDFSSAFNVRGELQVLAFSR